MATPTERPALSLAQAAKATGKHRNTIRNALMGDRFPNAYRDPSGAWRIPTADLLAAGFTLYAPTTGDPEAGAATASPSTSSPNEDVERLRAEVVELRRRVELAEAIAAERERVVERLLAVLPALPAEGRSSWRWPWSRRAGR